jgi:exopolyphosphatase/guanosine-5'-triphosphate,3'-diphosphate pyrophosphatase
VRLTEKFLPDPSPPFPAAVARQVAGHTREVLTQAGYPFALPAGTPAVGTGGTVTTVRAIRAAREGRDFEATDPVVSVSELRGLLAEVGSLPLAQRRLIPGLPPARADVFPTALATLLAIAELGRFPEYRNSTYTLRHGLAAAALAAN